MSDTSCSPGMMLCRYWRPEPSGSDTYRWHKGRGSFVSQCEVELSFFFFRGVITGRVTSDICRDQVVLWELCMMKWNAMPPDTVILQWSHSQQCFWRGFRMGDIKSDSQPYYFTHCEFFCRLHFSSWNWMVPINRKTVLPNQTKLCD